MGFRTGVQRGWGFYDHRKGKRAFVLAYSGGVFSKTFEGVFSFASAYSGLVGTMVLEGDFFCLQRFFGTMTIVGVSFRTGLRG